LKGELERALEKLGSPSLEDVSPHASDDEGVGGGRLPVSFVPRATPRRLVLPGRTLQHRAGSGKGKVGLLAFYPDGLVPVCRDWEDGEVSASGASSTLTTTASPRSTSLSEASEMPSCASVGGWPLTPPPSRDSLASQFESDGRSSYGQDPYLMPSASSSSSLLPCSSFASLPGSSTDFGFSPSNAGTEVGRQCSQGTDDPAGTTAQATGSHACASTEAASGSRSQGGTGAPSGGRAQPLRYGWALGAQLQPCRSDLMRARYTPSGAAPAPPLLAPVEGELELTAAVRARRRSVLADLVGCLHRIDEHNALAAHHGAGLPPEHERT